LAETPRKSFKSPVMPAPFQLVFGNKSSETTPTIRPVVLYVLPPAWGVILLSNSKWLVSQWRDVIKIIDTDTRFTPSGKHSMNVSFILPD
jgi:hypothetical protein